MTDIAPVSPAQATDAEAEGRGRRVCMHVLGTARTDQRVMREATALVAAGYDVTIVDVERDATRPQREDFRGVHLRHVVLPGRFARKGFSLRFLLGMAGMMQRCAWAVAATPADVYHAHDDTALPACFFAARLRRKRLILDAHELPLVQPTVTRSRVVERLAVRALRVMLRRSAGVITVSPPIAAEIRRRYGGPPPVLVRNVPVYQPPAPAGDELRRHLGLPADRKIALYQGGFQENRSLDLLVRVGKYLGPSAVIVLMGEGEMLGALNALIEELGVGDRVLITSSVPYDQLLRWTGSADVGLIVYRGSYSANVQYCLPNKLFEYLMAGVPVLASALDAVDEVIERYGTGKVVDSLEPREIAAALNAMLADADGLARMRANGYRATERDLRWDVEQRQLVGLYREVISG